MNEFGGIEGHDGNNPQKGIAGWIFMLGEGLKHKSEKEVENWLGKLVEVMV